MLVDYLQKGKPSTTSTGPEQSAILKQLGLVATSSEASASSNDEQVHNSNQDTEKREEVDNKPEDPFLPSERPQQKNKKKCWVCKTKLELAQRELGTCKCGEFKSNLASRKFSGCVCVAMLILVSGNTLQIFLPVVFELL